MHSFICPIYIICIIVFYCMPVPVMLRLRVSVLCLFKNMVRSNRFKIIDLYLFSISINKIVSFSWRKY